MTSIEIRQSFLDFLKSKSHSFGPGRLAGLIGLLGLSLFVTGCDSQSPASAVRLRDLDGHTVDPFEAAGAKAVVLIFLRTDCPISNGYAPEIQRLHGQFTSKGAAFWLVYVEADVSVEAVRRHLQEYQLAGRALLDPKLDLVRACQVRVTPEAAICEPGGRLVYHGRIDDRFAALGVERPSPTHRDLEEALTAIAEGKPISPTTTRAVGCAIPGAR